MASRNIPRIVIGGVSSGVGKTTVCAGLIAALRTRGMRVVSFKCGPDYLDPTYHSRASGTACQNLDGWMMGREAVLSTFARVSRDADIAVIEGVMGLFDGASPTGEEGSTAEIAKWLGAPVLLVLDASGMARTIAAMAHGFANFDKELNLAGLICNRLGSRSHLDLLRKSVQKPPILGGLPKSAGNSFPERHLGLRTASSDAIPDSLFETWGKIVSEWIDVDAILRIAAEAGAACAQPAEAEPAEARSAQRCRIGLAFDEAFHFYYEDNLTRLENLGVELVRFSPVRDATLPDVDGIYIGGGYPELFAAELSANRSMIDAVRRFSENGGVIYAECGGLMYLSSAIRTLDGKVHTMAGIIPLEAVMADKLQALGYVEVETQAPTILGQDGVRFRGHQFRYSDPKLLSSEIEFAYTIRKRRGGETQKEGYRVKNVLASYVHAHWASNPRIAANFVDACVKGRKG